MEKLVYKTYDEVVYSKVLENGLNVRILPKKGFHKTYALFSTNYGSIDNDFYPLNADEAITVPDGIAHFLEHKLFEKEDGDVFQVFGQQGASANAYTSFTTTAYLFSATQEVEKNLKTLIDFVQDPYFTEETVEKEKGIIAQEIQMYDDDPDWRLFFGLQENLFPEHPVSIDIAGTVQTIQDITADHLYTCYDTFYHPSNMALSIVGNIEPEEIMKLIEENQAAKTFESSCEIKRVEAEEDLNKIIPSRSIEMAVQRPKITLGIRGHQPHFNDVRDFKRANTLNLLLRLIFGSTSQTYLDLYDEGVIDDSFGYSVNYDRGYDYISLSVDNKEVEKTLAALKEVLLNAAESPELNQENFALVKKRMIGQNLISLNSVEYLARQLYYPQYKDKNIFDLLPLIEEITLEDVKKIAEEYIIDDYLSEFVILPKE